jgi:hypothetical protein
MEMTMRKLDRAFLKRTLGGEYPNGPRVSWTLLNEAEDRVYLLGWNLFYQDFAYPLRNDGFYAPGDSAASPSKGLKEWHDTVDRIRRGELEAGLILQLPQDPDADVLLVERILDGVFFGDIVESNGELWFRSDERVRINMARAPRQQSA